MVLIEGRIEVEAEDGVDRTDEQRGKGELGEVLLLVGHRGHSPSLQGSHFFIAIKNIFKPEVHLAHLKTATLKLVNGWETSLKSIEKWFYGHHRLPPPCGPLLHWLPQVQVKCESSVH